MNHAGEFERMYYMDAMRAVLMMLGVVIHSAQIFNPEKNWLIYSFYTTEIASYLVTIIHIFRMPSFFIISGFFCALTLNKYGSKKFIKIRIKRIVIPLVSTAILLNTFQAIILSRFGWAKFDLTSFFISGMWTSHLWFLINLIVYFLVALFVSTFFGKQVRKIAEIVSEALMFMPMILIITFLPFGTIFIFAINKIGFPLYSNFFGFLNLFTLLYYAPFFFFGLFLATSLLQIHRFSSINPIFSTISIICLCYLREYEFYFKEPLNALYSIYVESLICWLSVSICFFVFYRYLNLKSNKISFISDASYTVYLFHHIIVVCIGVALIKFNVPSLIGLLITVVFTTSLSLFIHRYFISKNRIARLLFNGK